MNSLNITHSKSAESVKNVAKKRNIISDCICVCLTPEQRYKKICFFSNPCGTKVENMVHDIINHFKKTAKEMSRTQKEQVAELLKSIETGAMEPMESINPSSYKQHNLGCGDGVEGFGEVIKALREYPEPAKVMTMRVFEDRDFVFAHTEYNFFGPKIGFDIFRFQGGQIVEHWDNLQEKPTTTNPSGHSMIDGETECREHPKTEENKELVVGFIGDVLMGRNPVRMVDYFEGDDFIQHNPAVGDGVSGLQKAMEWMQDNGITMRYDTVHKVLGEGNFVLSVCEGVYGVEGGAPTAFYDLFRIDSGKIAEHWDVMETIPPKAQWKNQNGKFGF